MERLEKVKIVKWPVKFFFEKYMRINYFEIKNGDSYSYRNLGD